MQTAKLITLSIFAFSVLSVVVAMDRFYIEKDYWVYANVDCNPLSQTCFLGSDSAQQFYSKIQLKAFAISPCNEWGGECTPLTCEDKSEAHCKQTYCNVAAGEACSGRAN